MEKTITVCGHSVEFDLSGTGSFSTWQLEELSKRGYHPWCTSDVCLFMRVDGTDIYKCDRHISSLKIVESLKRIDEKYQENAVEGSVLFNEFLRNEMILQMTVDEFLNGIEKN